MFKCPKCGEPIELENVLIIQNLIDLDLFTMDELERKLRLEEQKHKNDIRNMNYHKYTDLLREFGKADSVERKREIQREIKYLEEEMNAFKDENTDR